jgi:AraC-like DNA-binding protein
MRKIAVDTDEIVRLYVEDRLRARAIGKHLGVSESVVFRVLEEAGVKRSARAHLPMDEVIRLYVQAGWPLYRIAAKFGAASSTVARRLREVGVKTRTDVEARGRSAPRPRELPKGSLARQRQ